MVYLGNKHGSKAYRLFDPTSQRICVSRDVKFKEDEKWDWSKYPGENTNDEPEWTDFRIRNLEETNDHHDLENHPSKEVNDFLYNDDDGYDSPLEDSPTEILHTPLTGGYITLTDIYENTEELLLAKDEPKNYKEASNDQKWIEAMKDELDSINRNNTWKLTSLPPGHKEIGLKWVFKTKKDADGKIIKHKARLVAKGIGLKWVFKTKKDADEKIIKHKARLVATGYIQEHGIDFEEVLRELIHYVTLAEKLHKLYVQFVTDESGLGSVEITYTSSRETDNFDTPLVRAMLAKGICVNEEQVIVGGSSDKPLEIIKVQIANAASRLASEIKVKGRVKDGVPHLTKVGSLNVNLILVENIILCRQASHQPNIIGRDGCILAKENVNISSMSFGGMA
nr:ribonuclease H-like domain, reverse transcriptase, RNA-dependent DNA polymerase [Tanacetum cinerariifolium]